MISEKTFASTFSSFWQEVAPTGDGFVRMMNLAKRHFDLPLKSRSDPQRRALINELGFLFFKESIVRSVPPEAVLKLAEASKDITQLAIDTVQKYQNPENDEIRLPNTEETNESLMLAKRLIEFLQKHKKESNIVPSPYFFGCGYVDNCVGDILVNSTLYEIKSGDRPFRLVDVRQMLMYLALNFVNHKYPIESVGFVNPRLGTFFEITSPGLALSVSGKGLVDLLSDITDFVSSGGVSR